MTEISFGADSAKLTGMGLQPQFSLEQSLKEMVADWQGLSWTEWHC